MSSKILRGGKEKEEEEEAGKGGKRGGLTDVSCHLQTLRHYGTFPWASRKGRPETMPAHTQTRRAEDKHTDRQTSANNTVLGFRAPWIFLPPSTRFTLPNGVHCSPDSGSGEELPFPQSRQPSSALAGLGPALAGTSNPFPLYRKLSPAPDTFLLLSRAPDLHWPFLSCLSTGAISILPLCPGSVLFPRSRDPGRAPKCYARCPNPWAGREKPSKTMQLAKREVYCWLESGLLPHPTQWCGVREPRAQAVTQIYRVSTRRW